MRRKKKNSWLEEMRRGGWGGEKGSRGWMDGWIDRETSEEER